MIVSLALPVYNAEEFLEDCFESICKQKMSISYEDCIAISGAPSQCSNEPDCQTRNLELAENKTNKNITFEIELSLYEDGSSDSSPKIIEKWLEIFNSREGQGFHIRYSKNDTGSPKGVGYGRNQTIRQSTGEFICFCDADDVMKPDRISTQLNLCLQNPNALIGSKFSRIPEGSTKNFTQWANSISQDQLYTQIYLSFGPSLLMPTWFCRSEVYDKVKGGFDEKGKGVPEDLIFFYKHLDNEGRLVRAEKELVLYRYHENATTFSVTDEVIWNTRLERFESKVLSKWNKFSIWNAGKLGRRFYRSLTETSRNKTACFCDVDKKKIAQKLYHPYPLKTKVPIVHVRDAPPPFVICVKTELTFDETGDFHKLLESLNLQEGVDYYFFN